MPRIKLEQFKVLSQNIYKGKIAEKIVKSDYDANGFQVIKTGIGSDFIVIKNDYPYSSYQEYVEVKLGKARLTKKQQKIRSILRRQGTKYSIYRVSNEFLEHQISTNPKLLRLMKSTSCNKHVDHTFNSDYTLTTLQERGLVE